MRRLSSIGLSKKPRPGRFLCAGVGLLLPAAALAEPLDEASGVLMSCRQGPAIAVARARAFEGEAGVLAAGVLPNPSVVVEHRRALDGAADEESTVGLSVVLGLGGRRFLLEDAAEARRRQALREAALTRFESALAFREAFARAAIDRARVEILTEQQGALDALTKRLEGLHRGGDSGGYDLLRETLHAKTHRRLLALATGRAAASRLGLQLWVGRPVELAPLLLADLAASLERGRADLSQHPLALSLDDRASAAALDSRAARRRWIPDVEVFAGYRATAALGAESSRGLALSLRLPLTLLDHGQGEQAQFAAEQAVAEAARARLLSERQVELDALQAKLAALGAGDADEVAESALLLEQAKALYEAGELSIAELIDAQRAAEEAQLAAVDWAAERAEVRLAQMRAAGSFFDPALDRACAEEGATR